MTALVLLAMVRLLDYTENPLECAGIYAVLAFFLHLFFGSASFLQNIVYLAVTFVISAVYFYLLNRFKYTLKYWLVFVGFPLAIFFIKL
jgi:hypothetical protein